MAPEIYEEKPYFAQDADLFAAAVCLFTWVANHEPFSEAKKTDPYYKCIYKKRPDIYWKSFEKRWTNRSKKIFSKELQDLLS